MKFILIISSLFVFTFAHSSNIGKLIKKENSYFAQIKGKAYKITASKNISKYISSFDTKKSFFDFFGKISNRSIELTKSPQVRSGDIELTGKLLRLPGKNLNYINTKNGMLTVKFMKGVDYLKIVLMKKVCVTSVDKMYELLQKKSVKI
jgi:hypothetical protein